MWGGSDPSQILSDLSSYLCIYYCIYLTIYLHISIYLFNLSMFLESSWMKTLIWFPLLERGRFNRFRYTLTNTSPVASIFNPPLPPPPLYPTHIIILPRYVLILEGLHLFNIFGKIGNRFFFFNGSVWLDLGVKLRMQHFREIFYFHFFLFHFRLIRLFYCAYLLSKSANSILSSLIVHFGGMILKNRFYKN